MFIRGFLLHGYGLGRKVWDSGDYLNAFTFRVFRVFRGLCFGFRTKPELRSQAEALAPSREDAKSFAKPSRGSSVPNQSTLFCSAFASWRLGASSPSESRRAAFAL